MEQIPINQQPITSGGNQQPPQPPINSTQPVLPPPSGQPVAPTSITQTPKTSKHSRAKKVLIGLLLLITLALGAIYYFGIYKDGGLRIVPATYHYVDMEKVVVEGDKPGHGAVFLKPTELVDPTKQAKPKQNIDLFAYNVNNHRTQQISRISFSVGSNQPYSEDFYKKFNEYLLNNKSPDYDDTFYPLKAATSSRLGGAYTIKFEQAQKFRNETIKQNSWSANFSATKSKADSSMPDKVRGVVIIAISKDATYYFIVLAEELNWKVNHNIWQQVLSSLKIDQ